MSALRSCRESGKRVPPAPGEGWAPHAGTAITVPAQAGTAAGGCAASLSGFRSAAETTMAETVKVRRAGGCGRVQEGAGGCRWVQEGAGGEANSGRYLNI